MGRKNQAYEYLKKAIIDNEILPGTPVRELELAEKLQMSRSPIREALRELEMEGVIVSYPSRGTFVTTITPYDVEEIYELRVLHEVWALEKSIHRITDEELDEVANAFTDAFQAGDWSSYHVADKRLHALIIDRAGSKRLCAFVHNLNTQVERVRRFGAMEKNRIQKSYEEHMEIIDLIRQRDLPACREALKSHLRAVADAAIETAKIIDIV